MGDLEAIAALIHSYADLLDGGDLDGVTHLFDHATYRSGGAERRGFEQIRPVYDPVILYDDGTPRTKHVLTNLNIDLDAAAGTASTSCYFQVIQGVTPGEPIQIILAGRYIDRVERHDGAWRFADRLIIADLLGDGSRHYVI